MNKKFEEEKLWNKEKECNENSILLMNNEWKGDEEEEVENKKQTKDRVNNQWKND